jgi:hypothetical protein
VGLWEILCGDVEIGVRMKGREVFPRVYFSFSIFQTESSPGMKDRINLSCYAFTPINKHKSLIHCYGASWVVFIFSVCSINIQWKFQNIQTLKLSLTISLAANNLYINITLRARTTSTSPE